MRAALVTSLWLLVATAGCSFERRSTDFACDTPDDCTGGRVCMAGFCVDPDAQNDAGAIPDANQDADGDPGPDAMECPPGCTSCVGGECLIDCSATNACEQPITCPPGVPCRVDCGRTACKGGINCASASECTVVCSKMSACQNAITCGATPCSVQCTGQSSCTKGIDCSASCQCDILCTGSGACSMPSTCPGTGECASGNACTSSPAGCETCP